MVKSTVDKNRERDLYLTDGNAVWYIPQGWCDAWSVAMGFSGGLDFIDDDDIPQPEIMCYAPIHDTDNSEIDTIFVSVKFLDALLEINEQEARKVHPELFVHLSLINQGN